MGLFKEYKQSFQCIVEMFVIFGIVFIPNVQASWWFLSMSGTAAYQNTLSGTNLYYRSNCLNGDQLNPTEECKSSKNIMDVVQMGANMALDECQYQFRDRRWNCSTFNDTQTFGRVLDINSREKAYIYSISSAGVMHAITRACSKGELDNCDCDQQPLKRKPAPDFRWGGCSDDLNFGYRFTSDFVDSSEDKYNAPGLMNLWNNDAGRMTVKRNWKLVCKCHGVSASCEVKICWRAMPSFTEVGENLKAKFDGASLVKMGTRKYKLRPISREMKRPTHQDLVYLERSPDYCEFDPDNGIMGTRGRLCNITSYGLDGCNLMCCGRGYYTILRTNEEDCRCQFFWCCEVQCDKCKTDIEEHYCN